MAKLAFIGTGNMASAILRAVCRSVSPADITIYNRTPAKAEALAQELGCRLADSAADAVHGADYIFIGMKPQDFDTAAKQYSAELTPSQVLVSMVTGVTAEHILAATESSCPVVRLLPNLPCAIGKGVMLLCPVGASEECTQELEAMLAPCGLIGRTDEAHADAAMVAEGCTPAFAYMFIEALADGAVLTGLKRADAMRWCAQAVLGAAALVLESGKHPGQLKDEVCSPGGTTIEGVRALENAGLRAGAMNAIVSAWEKNKTMH